jgi:hypothetical protein
MACGSHFVYALRIAGKSGTTDLKSSSITSILIQAGSSFCLPLTAFL